MMEIFFSTNFPYVILRFLFYFALAFFYTYVINKCFSSFYAKAISLTILFVFTVICIMVIHAFLISKWILS